jgi:hypothetical protein
MLSKEAAEELLATVVARFEAFEQVTVQDLIQRLARIQATMDLVCNEVRNTALRVSDIENRIHSTENNVIALNRKIDAHIDDGGPRPLKVFNGGE